MSSDSKTEPNSKSKSTAEGHNNGVNRKSPGLSTSLNSRSDDLSKPSSIESQSAGCSGASSGAMPTFGATERAKKPKMDEKKTN